MNVKGRTYVIVVAAGSGTRFGADVPKQFCLLSGRPVLMWTLSRLREALPDADIRLVLSESGVSMWQSLCARYGYDSPAVVLGGGSRWESVKHAIDSLGDVTDNDVVMVHDGARPLVGKALVDRLLHAVAVHIGAMPGIAPVDSLRLMADDGVGSVPLDRSSVVAVQTPQVFRGGVLRRAYELEYSPSFTDDASVVSAAGYPSPCIVKGDPRCLKITLPVDIIVAEKYLNDERSAVD